MNAEFSFLPGSIVETNSPLNCNIFHPVDGLYGTTMQTAPDARTHAFREIEIKHLLLKPRKITEPDTDDNENPREQWDGKTIRWDDLPDDQVGRQKDSRKERQSVSKTSFLIIVNLTHEVLVTANKFCTHSTSEKGSTVMEIGFLLTVFSFLTGKNFEVISRRKRVLI